MGIVSLMTGAGAAQGIQEILKQRLLEREMALKEQSLKAEMERNSVLDQERRDNTKFNHDLANAQLDSVATQREGMAVDRAAGQTPFETSLNPRMAEKFKAWGYPTKVGTESADDMPIPMDIAVEQSAWGAPKEATPRQQGPLKLRGSSGKPVYRIPTDEELTQGVEAYNEPTAATTSGGSFQTAQSPIIGNDGKAYVLQSQKDGSVRMVPLTQADGSPFVKQPTASERKDIRNATTAIAHIGTMRSLIQSNPTAAMGSKVPGAGFFSSDASTYKTASENASDVLTRMRTGAALNANEQEFYNGMMPTFADLEYANRTGDYRAVNYKLDSLEYVYRQWAGAGEEEPVQGDPNAGKRMVMALRQRMSERPRGLQSPTVAEGTQKPIPGLDGGIQEYRNGKWIRVK